MLSLSEEQERMLLDTYATLKKQGEEHIVLDTSKDDDGQEFHVIRDNLAEPGKRVLFKIEKDVATMSHQKAERRLTDIRRMRLIKAIVAIGAEIERQDQAFRRAN